MRHANTFVITMYGDINYLLLMPNLIAFLIKIECNIKNEFHFVLEVSFSISAVKIFAVKIFAFKSFFLLIP